MLLESVGFSNKMHRGTSIKVFFFFAIKLILLGSLGQDQDFRNNSENWSKKQINFQPMKKVESNERK